ncbi:Sec7 domain-containing protein [Seiridium cupressi]
MHSMENGRRSQRRRPDLNINTSASASKSPSHRRDAAPASPPLRKPPNPSKGKPPVSSRALKVQPSSASSLPSNGRDRDFEESFLDNDTPIDTANKENEPGFRSDRPMKSPANYRDSHDLSLPARQVTRDSLVTNMLMSLDKLSLAQINTPPTPMSPFDEAAYGSVSHGGEDMARSMSGVSGRPGRGMHSSYNHGHGYSYSSDLEGTDDAASRISSQFSRGRRSNSSSGFQSSLGRINSMRETSSPRANTMASGRPLHSRGGKTSSTNSFDAGYAQVLSSQRISHGIGGRSSSFDDSQPNSGNTNNSGSAWNIEFSTSLFANDYEVAPTPTVPGGPRRPSAAILPPAPPPVPKDSDPSERNRSLRSRGSTAARPPSKARPYEMPPQAPMVDLDAAPAPNVGYEKSKTREAPSAPPTSTPQAKERPGFFRRVFGGSSRNISSTFESSSPAPVSAPSAETIERQASSKSSQHIAAQMKNASTPPSRDSQQSQPHVIQKKSSFFRRRKKSVAEPPPLPQPPQTIVSPPAQATDLDIERTKPIELPDQSPISSLRQVMNPYLKNSNPGTPSRLLSPRLEREIISPEYDVEDGEYERRRKSRGFSPDYDPSPNATIRPVKSHSALNNRSRESVTTSTPRRSPRIDSPNREPPQVPNSRPKLSRDTTFFEDNSDTDGDKSTNLPREERMSSLLSPSDLKSLSGGFPTPPGTTPRDSPRPPPTPELIGANDESSLQEATSPSLLLQHNISNEEDKTRPDSLGLPIQSQQSSSPGKLSVSGKSTPHRSRSAASLPSVKIDNAEISPKMTGSPLDEPEITVGEPTEDDLQKARRIFDGNEDFIQKDRAAAWMGEEGLVRQRTLRAYMELYDFAEKSVLTALREICDRLILRAETQQIDRILVSFSKRWCECNSNHGFKAMDVIHTMCYSIMLLNTDLHMADIEHKMTRSQFVKNTMTTVKAALADSDPDAFDRPSILPGKNALLSPTESESQVPVEQERKNWRASFIPPRSDSRLGDYGDQDQDTCGPLVKAPFNGTMRQWEAQMEVVLKDIYNSIRDDRLPLFGGSPEQAQPQPQQGGLSVMNMLKRTPSVLSKAPSESASMTRGRVDGSNGPSGGRWSSKSRSRPRIGNAGFSSSRTSFDDGNSIWSPTVSSATWSRYSLGRTQTSPSMDSLGSRYFHGDYQQSIGFANALSQAIIREDHQLETTRSIISEEVNGATLLEDESLELTGPPWVKEGIVIHKHHLDGIDKKAKDRNWSEVFVVIQKGQMSLFSFSTKSMRQKARLGRKQAPGAVVGGGNWQENATNLGTFSLRQTLASALPPPGYSRTRPHVWALSLPTGAVHLFQVGTPELGKEFVLTINYWSARLSTHPLVGGISNIEYGWSDACINNALVTAIAHDNPAPPRPGSAAAGRTSMHSRNGSRQSSLRSSFEVGGSSARTKLPGDRIHISEWTPPAQSLRASNFSESEQLETLVQYVKGIEEELQKHNQLRSPMLLAFTPRGNNGTKAMANWEKKSSYLLREIVKFRTYVDCLQYADGRRKEVYDEREVARRAARGEDDEGVHDGEDDTIRIEAEDEDESRLHF